MRKQYLRHFYNHTAARIETLKKINWYYHRDLRAYYRFLIPEGASVLEIGCGTGDLLASLNPSKGVGIDMSDEMIGIAHGKYPHLSFSVMDAEHLALNDRFDYVIVSGTLAEMDDIQHFFLQLKNVTHGRTRIVMDYYNHLWHPIAKLIEIIKLKDAHLRKNWISAAEIDKLLLLSDFETIKHHTRMLLPVYIPLVSALVNNFLAKLPLVNRLCLEKFIIARPVFRDGSRADYSCSVIVPARNEKGTIEQLVQSMPDLGSGTEIIFIEGHSTDGTREEIERVVACYPHKRLRLIRQDRATGKVDAVRLGFEAAGGDMLMILDADLSVHPGVLTKSYHALAENKAEFVGSSRLLYPIEKRAMGLPNRVANYVFGKILSWLLEYRLTDALCGTKAMWRDDYRAMKKNGLFSRRIDPFGDFELLFGAAELNLKYLEIPVRYRARVYGKTNIRRWRHGLSLVRVCWLAFWKSKIT
jgi:SAM-dependent methyltransferase